MVTEWGAVRGYSPTGTSRMSQTTRESLLAMYPMGSIPSRHPRYVTSFRTMATIDILHAEAKDYLCNAVHN